MPRRCTTGQHIFNRGEYRFRFHHHPSAAAIRIIVSSTMFILGRIPDIVKMNGEKPLVLSPLDYALAKGPLKHPWEDGQNIKTHLNCPHPPASQAIPVFCPRIRTIAISTALPETEF